MIIVIKKVLSYLEHTFLNLHLSLLKFTFPVGKITEKAVCRSVYLLGNYKNHQNYSSKGTNRVLWHICFIKFLKF